MAILAVNAGSSSLKFALYPVQDGAVQSVLMSGNIQGLEPQGDPQAHWHIHGEDHNEALPEGPGNSFERALAWLHDLLEKNHELPKLASVAHRVVHGGSLWTQSVIVTPEIVEQLESLNSLAPLHQPHNVAGIRHFAAAFPAVPQVACFDTVYHSTISKDEHCFALPQELTDSGIRRYGFHGLSYQYIMGALQQHTPRANGRVLMAHLGNGASLCGAKNGLSQASTMGFSALDGLIMGTRSGTLDAGVLLYLMEQGWDHTRIQKLLYKESGLLGISGISADMRRLRADSSKRAKRAITMFVHRIVRQAGAMVACLEGLDVLAFSGGIGERDALTRAEVCERLQWLGARLDPELNAAATGDTVTPVHAADSTVEIWVVPTDEGRVAAQEAAKLLAKHTLAA